MIQHHHPAATIQVVSAKRGYHLVVLLVVFFIVQCSVLQLPMPATACPVGTTICHHHHHHHLPAAVSSHTSNIRKLNPYRGAGSTSRSINGQQQENRFQEHSLTSSSTTVVLTVPSPRIPSSLATAVGFIGPAMLIARHLVVVGNQIISPGTSSTTSAVLTIARISSLAWTTMFRVGGRGTLVGGRIIQQPHLYTTWRRSEQQMSQQQEEPSKAEQENRQDKVHRLNDNENSSTPPQEENSQSKERSATISSSSNTAGVMMIASIGLYKNFISPLLPPACRFLPTCSQYGIQAIMEFGPTRGAVLIAWRLLRCSPIGGRGYDPPQWPPVPFTYRSY